MPGLQELIVIAVVALLVFGPERLPEVARQAARLLARVRAETQRNVGELRRMAEIQDLERELREIRRELRGVRDEVSGATGDPTAEARHRALGRQPLDAESRESRPDGRPPPFDPEAT